MIYSSLHKMGFAMFIGLLSMHSPARATLLYSDNFSHSPNDRTPLNWSASPNWSIIAREEGNVYAGVDDDSSKYYNSGLSFATIAWPNNASIIEFSFDLRVENYHGLTPGGIGTFRVTLQPNENTDDRYSIGLGYANAVGSNTVFFYAAPGASSSPSASNAIGWNPDGDFAPGFKLGTLGKQPQNGTGGNIYRLQLSLTPGTGAIRITIINLSDPSQKAVYTDTWHPIEITSSGNLMFTTGVASMGLMEISNLTIQSISEASVSGFSGTQTPLCGVENRKEITK